MIHISGISFFDDGDKATTNKQQFLYFRLYGIAKQEARTAGGKQTRVLLSHGKKRDPRPLMHKISSV